MTHRINPPRPLPSLGILALALALAGCSNTPGSYSSGRMDPYETTKGETRESQVLPVALLEFSDQVAQELPQKIADIPEIRAGGKPVTVIVGDINNKTGNVSSNDFEMVRSRIRNSVLQSRFVSDRVTFVENRARMQALAAREGVGTPTGDAGPAPYDPATTYFLNGDFYRINRNNDAGDTNQYYMEFQLVNAGSYKIIPFAKYEVKQWRP